MPVYTLFGTVHLQLALQLDSLTVCPPLNVIMFASWRVWTLASAAREGKEEPKQDRAEITYLNLMYVQGLFF